jgi:hypothetical protein
MNRHKLKIKKLYILKEMKSIVKITKTMKMNTNQICHHMRYLNAIIIKAVIQNKFAKIKLPIKFFQLIKNRRPFNIMIKFRIINKSVKHIRYR